jgi:alkylresorcinol/alkylpyrone synthase
VRNEAYIDSATDLSASVCNDLFKATGVRPADIDYIIYVNTTGLATPSIDARLINLLGLDNNIRRIPVWGLGCVGGVAGLSHAHHYLLGHPGHRVLLVASEFCSLTFLPDDFSMSNLVASALFGDGAAAVLITGDDIDADGPEIIDTRSTFYPDSLDVMGWNVVSEGLQVVFAKRIPDIVRANVRSDLANFLSDHDLALEDIDSYLIHPGGAKVLQAYQAALGMNSDSLKLPWEILRNYGNMSSVTVLFVLSEYLQTTAPGTGKLGLISALGPGFCSESVLVRL